MTALSCQTRSRPSSDPFLGAGGEEKGGQWLPSPRLGDNIGIATVGDARGVRTSKPTEILPGACGLGRAVGRRGLWSGPVSQQERELPWACSFCQFRICEGMNGVAAFPHPASFPLPSFQACCVLLSIWRVCLSESSNVL